MRQRARLDVLRCRKGRQDGARLEASGETHARPSRKMRPASERTRPDIWSMSVVFPAPFGPMIAWISPVATPRLTCVVTCTPASTMVEVTKMVSLDYLIEINAIAVVQK